MTWSSPAEKGGNTKEDFAMKTTTTAWIAGLAIATGAAAFAQENPMVGGAEMMADRNIVENAANSADHTTLVAAVQAAGLAETLSGEGPFTVFAPTLMAGASCSRVTGVGTSRTSWKAQRRRWTS